MIKPISITAIGSVSPLGDSLDEVWSNYKKDSHFFRKKEFESGEEWIAGLSQKSLEEIEALKQSDSKYKNLDNTVLFALLAARKAMKMAHWKAGDNFGINMGSSRGATALFEKYHKEYITENKASTLSSPTTTLGNISSWIAHDLQTQGPEISHSITCSTALHALLNGVAWIQSGLVNKFMVGGSEAPLTPFTLAQIKALKIYSNSVEDYPCQALNLEKKRNTMILGEGASVACLENGNSKNALATIEGIGYATEILKHNISISSDAVCFQRSMKMALAGTNPDDVDVIVMHAPGTIKGDISEFKAIEKVFCNETPSLTTNKWKVGHTFGASGALSLEFAVLMLVNQEFIGVPFIESTKPSKIKKIIVNAVGFGGNAVSILLSK
ncbi:3-oxoacyl-(acyl-carrier-protein) synthase [Maribacter vaceletii]|uniref:3-oxoacyl-(Acyl-carrier-protein) synthase n=1 Tax=Maribacter vaceletii TaxID=1206816 RepID=A0A495EDU1_9FLAO|nr:beta-ketoacyl synthase N-terminal-like domain-containing protein [Maribacter vaceletii]RKR15054.1 3-oxoacyl-(acyl-carrier-protein) synthase [Maribacter vaceletii]